MNNRERFHNVMHYQPVDYVPFRMVGPWAETRERWHREGLPRDADLREHLGVPPFPFQNISGNTQLHPWFDDRVIREEGEYVFRTDTWGRTVRDLKHHSVVPEWLAFPVNTPDDLRRVMDERLDLDDLDARYPPDWPTRVAEAAAGDAVLMVNAGWYYWTLRSLAGVETASYLLYDAVELVDELFERLNVIALDGIRRAAKLTRIDAICFGEDIAYKNGPLMSPEMNRRLLIPRYRKVMDLAVANGCDMGWFGSDGDLRLLIPDYLEVGVNITEPCEVAAGMVPTELRRRFGRELRVVGGIDKREIAKGPRAIDVEIEHNRPLIDDGGFLPSIDHSVPADISWANYAYYVDKMKAALGIA